MQVLHAESNLQDPNDLSVCLPLCSTHIFDNVAVSHVRTDREVGWLGGGRRRTQKVEDVLVIERSPHADLLEEEL
jgi:hypothetical protein